MDASRLLTEFLPPDLAVSVRQHLLNPTAPFQIYKQRLATQAQAALASLSPHVQPLLDRVLVTMLDNSGITGLLVLLVLMTLVAVVMSWIRRLVMWWTRMVLKAVFWAGVVVVAAWVWDRGVWECARDAVVVVAKILGYLAVLRDFWMAEYQRYEADGSAGRPSAGRPISSGRGRR